MNNHNEEEGIEASSLTLNKLLVWCAVGAILWLGIIRIGVMIWEIV